MRNAQHIIEKISILSKAQRRFLVIAVQAIVCCRWRINFRSLSEVSVYGEKTYRRHYGATIDFIPIHRAVADSVLGESVSGFRVIGFDPTFLPKAGKHTPGVGKFWNGSAQRAESGLEATLTAVIDVERRIAFPLGLQQTLHPSLRQTIGASADEQNTSMPEAVAEATTKTPTTKKTASPAPWLITEYLRHLERVKPSLHPTERHVVADAYFAKQTFLDGVAAMGLFCITKLRTDANLKYFYRGEARTSGRGRQKVYDGKVLWENLRTDVFHETRVDDTVLLRSAILYHVGLKRTLLIVLVQEQRGASTRQTILASTDEHLDALSIYKAYGARFQLEFLLRDGKGFTGLTDAQTRTTTAIDTHLNMSMFALALARAEHYQTFGLESERPFSMNAAKTRAFNEHFALHILSIYGLSPEMIKNHPHFSAIRNYAIAEG